MKTIETTPANDSASQAELLSALHDGQLDAASAAALVRASLANDSLIQQWRSMSAISSVLAQVAPAALAQSSLATPPMHHAGPLHMPKRDAANDGIFRWKMVAGFAALAAVGSLIWGLVSQQVAPAGAVLALQSPAAAGSIAPSRVIVQASTGGTQEPLVMIRDARLDELLAAHKQFGGMSALQQPAGTLRSVSLVSNRP